MQAAREVAVLAELLPGHLAHARHDPHAQGDVDRVGHLHADAGQGRTGRSHDERDNVQGPAVHAPVEQPAEQVVSLPGRHPVVGSAGEVFAVRADVRAVLGARHVVGVAAVQVTAGQLVLV